MGRVRLFGFSRWICALAIAVVLGASACSLVGDAPGRSEVSDKGAVPDRGGVDQARPRQQGYAALKVATRVRIPLGAPVISMSYLIGAGSFPNYSPITQAESNRLRGRRPQLSRCVRTAFAGPISSSVGPGRAPERWLPRCQYC